MQSLQSHFWCLSSTGPGLAVPRLTSQRIMGTAAPDGGFYEDMHLLDMSFGNTGNTILNFKRFT